METKPRKLPIGIQTFDEIREENYIYVDKTQYLVNMIDNGKLYFYARPRRFGKSLTVSTFDALFSGKKELFKGLYAEEFMNRPDYRPSPVIRIDMSNVTTNKGIDILELTVTRRVIEIAEKYGINIPDTYPPGEALRQLIKELAKQDGNGKVVILIDEYDKPYTDFYTEPQKAEEIRKMLRDFYSRIKANDEYIRFVFLTGIAKFAKFGVFSTLNNIMDISMNKQYGEMCGITEAEIERYFPEHIAATADKFNISPKELLERIRAQYDGFCFDGIHRLYNPFSTLYFFREMEFNDYWMESGTSAMIAKYLKDRHLTLEQFRRLPVSNNFLRTPGDLDTTPPEGFLYQAGYLTVREQKGDKFVLDYPNTEVLNAMSALLAQNILPADKSFGNLQQFMLRAIEEKNENMIKKILNALLASIPYDDYAASVRQSIALDPLDVQVREWLYRSTIIAFFRGCGVATVAEMHTNLGRPDLVISYLGNTFVIELKVAYKPEDVPAKLTEADKQIKSKNYLTPYPDAIALAMVIDDTKRQITH
ncbi:MAG: ATP-binding protein [Tannerella sp.]|nr:ATP-binding protein [Tannerella sp.]